MGTKVPALFRGWVRGNHCPLPQTPTSHPAQAELVEAPCVVALWLPSFDKLRMSGAGGREREITPDSLYCGLAQPISAASIADAAPARAQALTKRRP